MRSAMLEGVDSSQYEHDVVAQRELQRLVHDYTNWHVPIDREEEDRIWAEMCPLLEDQRHIVAIALRRFFEGQRFNA